MNSTSFHSFESDRGFNKFKKILWLIFNVANNSWNPNKNSNCLNIKRFCPELQEADWEIIHPLASPSRTFCDFYWRLLDWQAIKKELSDIYAFDTGCGIGDYAIKLYNYSNCIKQYFGVDAKPHKNWQAINRENKIFQFQCETSNNIYKLIPEETNFFLSQSAIEHFQNDLLYFKQIKRFINESGKNTIQIHMCPSSAALKLYLWHGVRQYNYRTISKITDIFDSRNSYSVLYELGGLHSSRLHFNCITKPARIMKQKDWRFVKNYEYQRLRKEAVEKDLQTVYSKPIFYALVIHSNFKNKIFENMDHLTQCCG